MLGKIEIIAPSSAEPNPDTIKKAIDKLESFGFEVSMPNDIIGGDLVYEANTVEYRLTHLREAAKDSHISAILGLKGGYSSCKIANRLMEADHLQQTKHIVGFSDMTALFLALNQKHGWLCVHGSVLIKFAATTINPESLQQVVDIISNKVTSLSMPNLIPLNNVKVSDSNVEGKLTGGNLSIVVSSIGTSWEIDCKDKILFIEDVGEAGYKLDRMFTQLIQTGILKDVKGIVLGDFYNKNAEDSYKKPVDYALSQFAKQMEENNCPVFKTNEFGHYYNNTPLVIGAEATIKLNPSKPLSVGTTDFIDAISNLESPLIENYTLAYNWDSNFI